MKLSYTSEIKGYQKSIIAKSERNDCVVRALSAAFDIDYDTSHKIAKEDMKRKERKGTMTYFFHNFLENFEKKRRQLNHCILKEVNTSFCYVKNGKPDGMGTKTVGRIIKENPKGTFLFSVRGHAFTVKDGVVVGGNWSDSKKMRVRAQRVWEVIKK